MQCRNCHSESTRVIDSREINGTRRRRYRCQICGEKFSTLESYSDIAIYRDGSWVSNEHLDMIARQMQIGADELISLAKLLEGRNEHGC